MKDGRHISGFCCTRCSKATFSAMHHHQCKMEVEKKMAWSFIQLNSKTGAFKRQILSADGTFLEEKIACN